jgi:hypothetical protein
MGRGQPVYALTLQVKPFTKEVPTTFQAPPIESLIYPFNLWIERGLANLGNYGVTTDVMQLRTGVLQDMELSRHLTQLEEAEAQAIARAEACRTQRRRIAQERLTILSQLEAAQVFFWLSKHLTFDRDQGNIPFPLWYHTSSHCPTHTNISDSKRRPGGPSNRSAAARHTAAARATQARRMRQVCTLCEQVGHFLWECPQPHTRCTIHQCHINVQHPHFHPEMVCPYHWDWVETNPLPENLWSPGVTIEDDFNPDEEAEGNIFD